MNDWKIELVCSTSCLHFESLLILLILDELETLLKQKDNESISKRGSEPSSDGKGNHPSVGQHRAYLTFVSIESDYAMSPWYKSAHNVDALSASSHTSRSPPQLLHAEVSISEPTSSPSASGLEMIWTACPSSLPGPELLRHLYVLRHRSQPPALNARFAGLMFSLNSIHMRVACSMQHHS